MSSGIVHAESMPAVQIIPPLLQLYPEIEVEHADDTNALLDRAALGKWTWLFAGRTVYLVAPPEGFVCSSSAVPITPQRRLKVLRSMRILHNRDIAPLLALYLSETGQAERSEAPGSNSS